MIYSLITYEHLWGPPNTFLLALFAKNRIFRKFFIPISISTYDLYKHDVVQFFFFVSNAGDLVRYKNGKSALEKEKNIMKTKVMTMTEIESIVSIKRIEMTTNMKMGNTHKNYNMESNHCFPTDDL